MSEETGSDVCRLRIEFENNEIDWEHPLDLNGRIIKAMYVNDERIRECYACSKLAELIAENNALLVKVVDLTEEREQWREAAGNAHEMWEQADNERIMLAEQLEASRRALEILTLDKAKLQTKIDKLTADVSQAVEYTAERVTNKGEMLDSREKLEADALVLVDNLRMYGGKYAGDAEVEIIGMLNRQAAITERKHLELACAFQLESDKRITELQAKVDELTANNANLHELASTQADEIDELQAKVDKLEGGSND
ncbi:MAG: hypothetical protein IIZ12_01745 [Eggerthellaceae bacterium]|nr:hypothetical protein [Eggerthellaceae bacterium]